MRGGRAAGDRGGLYDAGYVAVLVLPVVAGACAGAGLFARELEQGTAVLALTQSVSRLRWWTTGLLVAGVPAAAAVALLTPVATRALGLTGSGSHSRLESRLFQMTGLAPAAYTLLAFAVAAVGGMLLRNTLGAVVLTVVTQVALVVGLTGELRRYYAPADELRTPSRSRTAPACRCPARQRVPCGWTGSIWTPPDGRSRTRSSTRPRAPPASTTTTASAPAAWCRS